jgi:hypothetical protein
VEDSGPVSTEEKNLLKFLFWKVWLERNNKIFCEESIILPEIALKIKFMMEEAVKTKHNLKNSEPLNQEEDN